MSYGRKAHSTWQAADVKRPLMSVAKMITPGNFVHLDMIPESSVIPLREAGNVFFTDLWVKRDASGNTSSFHRQA